VIDYARTSSGLYHLRSPKKGIAAASLNAPGWFWNSDYASIE